MEKKNLSDVVSKKSLKEKVQETTSSKVLGALKSVTVRFVGGVGDKKHTLTGSGTLVKISRTGSEPKRILVDFGVHQGKNSCELNKEIPINPAKIDALIETHAHMDHIGRIPMLINGENIFRGKVYATNVTKALSLYMLKDGAKVMKNRADEVREMSDKKEKLLIAALKKKNKLKKLLQPSKKDKKDKGFRKNHARLQKHKARYNSEADMKKEFHNVKKTLQEAGVKTRGDLHKKFGDIKNEEEEKVLYTEEDALKVFSMTRGKKYYEKIKISEGVYLTFMKSAHILGSAQVILEIDDGKGGTHNMGFSGDLGRYDEYNNLGHPDNNFQEVLGGEENEFAFDSYQIESTYGGKPDHPDVEEDLQRMAGVIQQVNARRGKIIMPSFMLQRSQDMLGHLLDLKKRKLIPAYIPLYYDGLTIEEINNIFRAYDIPSELYSTIFSLESGITKPGDREDNAFLKNDRRSGILVAPSGMLSGGKVLSYLEHICPDKNNAMFFVGYQAEGTLGHQIATEGYRHIMLEDQSISIAAQVHIFKSFSSHGDEIDLLSHLEKIPFKKDASLFLNHGDIRTSQKLFEMAIKEYGVVPEDVEKKIIQPRVGDITKVY